MALAINQVRLLALTARKADCELDLTLDSTRKMALAREMSQLSQEYNSKLQSKNIAFYANGKYNKMNYQYLMGYGNNYFAVWDSGYPLKDKNSMILTDYKGQVVMSDAYKEAIIEVLGQSAMDYNGRGGTFSKDYIPEILAALFPGFTADDFQDSIDGIEKSSSYDADVYNTLTGEDTFETVEVDNSSAVTEKIKAIVDFYYPIFVAAANNGWTSEYKNQMESNDDYVSDALISGTFHLTATNANGDYDNETNLNYFITAGFITTNTSSETREEITAWYEAEKEEINIKETAIDLRMSETSTELEAIKTEIQSIQSLIDDAVSSVFDWGGG